MIWHCERSAQSDLAAAERLHPAGFTLIELLIVLTIMGLALSVFGWRPNPVSIEAQAASAAEQIFSALRAARAEAFSSNRSVEFTLDVATHRFAWDGHPIVQLPTRISVAMLTERAQTAGAEEAGIRFDPDGGSTGGRVSVSGGGRAYVIGVDWISGRVTFLRKEAKG